MVVVVVVVGGRRSWIPGEGCGGGGWAGVVIRGGEDEEEGSPCGGENGGLGSEPDASGVDGCVFSAVGGGGSSWIRGWVVGLVGGGVVGGDLVGEGGEIRGLRVDNGGGEGGVTGGEEGPDAKRYQHAVLFPFMYKGASSGRLCAMFLAGKERGGAKKYPWEELSTNL